MALQKGERCCGKEEGPAGITCCFCMCGQLWAPPATRGWEKQENLFRTPKKQSSLFSQRITGAHMGRMKPQRAEAQEMLTLWAMLPCAKPPCEAAAGGDRQNAETWGHRGEAVVASLSAGWLRSPWALALMKAPTGLTFPGLQSIPEMI